MAFYIAKYVLLDNRYNKGNFRFLKVFFFSDGSMLKADGLDVPSS